LFVKLRITSLSEWKKKLFDGGSRGKSKISFRRSDNDGNTSTPTRRTECGGVSHDQFSVEHGAADVRDVAAVGISAEYRDVPLDPFERRDLVHQAVVSEQRSRLFGGEGGRPSTDRTPLDRNSPFGH
jgi:hypothetical protein